MRYLQKGRTSADNNLIIKTSQALSLLWKPDFTFRRERVVVFVDGCFWHGCPKCYKRPGSNQEFWDNKIAANRKRDRLVSRELKLLGWHVVRVWQHQLVQPLRIVAKLRNALA